MDPAAALTLALEERGGPRLAALEYYAEIGSTSDRLKELARAGAEAWTAVVAERQTGGRGREGRSWESPAGGCYLSVLLRPQAARTALLPLAAGVAVAEAVQGFGVASELKWPNDVLVGGRKLAGILAEASSGGERRRVGGARDRRERLRRSGRAAGVAARDRHLARRVRSARGAAAGRRRGHARASLRLVRCAAIRAGSACCPRGERGRCRGGARSSRFAPRAASGRGRLAAIDEEGALVLETAAGERLRLFSGEVSRVRAAPQP